MLANAQDVADALRSAGVSASDIVYVNSAIWKFGPIFPKSKDELLNVCCEGFRRAIGENGTLCVNAQTAGLYRAGQAFYVEQTPTDGGMLNEHVRQLPDSMRSVHPVVSVAAVGHMAGNICEPLHYSGFGYQSPYMKLLELDAKIVSFGPGFGHHSTAYQHFVESMFGVPYQYTKIFPIPVLKNNQQIDGPFTLNVRYANLNVEYDAIPFRKGLVDSGIAKLVRLGRGEIMVVSASDFFRKGIYSLSKDRYAFCARPPTFIPGEIPLDGPAESTRAGVSQIAHLSEG